MASPLEQLLHGQHISGVEAFKVCRKRRACEIHYIPAAQTKHHTNALKPVMDLPTISVFISLVPS